MILSSPFRRSVVAAVVLMVPFAAAAAAEDAQPNTCLACHAALAEARLSAPARAFTGTDVHRSSGFACVDCHGGDRTAVDKVRAHDPARGFRGAPRGEAQIAACARCHSDAEVMRRYAPRQRVDQAAEYATSVHGKRLMAGDTRVATCASCHGAHGVRPVNDVQSPVFPTHVATTCASCHADPRHMAGYTLPNGSPLPTSQYADYLRSVHYAALTKANDLSAPTCNDCHGNHGAVPPGAGSVANVCGTCHAVFAQKFQTSVHSQIFDRGCVECHGNHAVLKPSDEMLGTDPHAICASCHSGAGDKGLAAAARMRGDIERLKAALDSSTRSIESLRNAGMEMNAQEVALGTARSNLTLARTEMHTFDPPRVTAVVDQGMTIVAGVDRAAAASSAELRYRRRGLALSLGAILLVIVALGFKIRQIDRRL